MSEFAQTIHDALCHCGRPIHAAKPHCIACGSSNIFYRRVGSVGIKMEDGSVIEGRGYVCRACGTCFHEFERCEAPAKRIQNVKAASQNRMGAPVAGFSKEDAINALGPYAKEKARKRAKTQVRVPDRDRDPMDDLLTAHPEKKEPENENI